VQPNNFVAAHVFATLPLILFSSDTFYIYIPLNSQLSYSQI